MNSYEINYLGRKMIRVLFKFSGVYAADTFITAIDILSTQAKVKYIVNIDLSHSTGLTGLRYFKWRENLNFLIRSVWGHNIIVIWICFLLSVTILILFRINLVTLARICLLFLHLRSDGLLFFNIILCSIVFFTNIHLLPTGCLWLLRPLN